MVTLRERKKFAVDNFMGVDYSNSVFNVKKNRATTGYNFINKNGYNHKRNGWETVLQIKDTDGNPQQINGFWNLYIDGVEYIIVHAGNRLYKVTFNGNFRNNTFDDITPNGFEDFITNTRSYGIIKNHNLYLLCGAYLVYGNDKYGDISLRKVVDDPLTTIPTTTIGIESQAFVDGGTATGRYTYEQPNLLCSRRKNTAKGSVDTDDKVYFLDSTVSMPNGIIEVNSVKITVETFKTDENGNEVLDEYDNRIAQMKVYINSDIYNTDTLYLDTDTTFEIPIGTIQATTYYGVSSITMKGSENTEIIGYDLSDNITIEFKVDEWDTSRLDGCTFGTTFGVGGNNNRLFVAGNISLPNCDWFSEQDDFTYFGSGNVARYGSEQNPIMCYSRLADGTLAVHKQQDIDESTIYYRSMSVDTTEDNPYDLDRVLAPVKAGAMGIGAVSRWANGDLAGDKMILSKNGVYGVSLTQNLVTSERFARERSELINGKLFREADMGDFEKAVGFVFDNKYFLSIGDNVYIADARYKSTRNQLMDDTYEYEWWHWINTPAYVWGSYDNTLYFGTLDGRICRFTQTSFADITSAKHEGEITVGDIPTRLIGNAEINIVKGDIVEIDGVGDLPLANYIMNGEFTLTQDENETYGTFTLTNENMTNKLITGQTVYVNGDNTTEYIIGDTDFGNLTFKLFTTDMTEVPYTTLAEITDFYFDLTGLELTVNDISESGTNFELIYNSYIVSFSLPAPDLILLTHHIENVDCQWITPCFDLGTNTNGKKLFSLTLSTEPTVNSECQFGYLTRELDKVFNSQISNLFDFNNINFNMFSMVMSRFTSAFTKVVHSRDFNYIMLRFGNNGNSDCVVNSIVVEFSVINKNKGVK